MENLNLKPTNIAKAIRMNNWGPVKKQATRPVAAWLDKQNKQLLIAINKLFLSRFSKPGQADSPHDDFFLRRLQRSCSAARIFS